MDLKLLGTLLHDLVQFVSPNFQADLHKRVDELIGGNAPADGSKYYTPAAQAQRAQGQQQQGGQQYYAPAGQGTEWTGQPDPAPAPYRPV